MICPDSNKTCENSCAPGGCKMYDENWIADQCREPPSTDIAEIERLAGDVSMALSALLAAVKKNLQL